MDEAELEIIRELDRIVSPEPIRAEIDSVVKQVEQKISSNPAVLLDGDPVPLKIYGNVLPDMIRSSWVFVVRNGATTGAERHPNSHQRMMSYRGSGDIQVWKDDRWCSNQLVSDIKAPVESRWMSIPVNIWHQAMVTGSDWVVLSFHTVTDTELIEERPDEDDTELIHRRKYIKESGR